MLRMEATRFLRSRLVYDLLMLLDPIVICTPRGLPVAVSPVGWKFNEGPAVQW